MAKRKTSSTLPVSIVWFCRLAVGLLFIFSGLIKANDPLGFSYKLEEYFEVFHKLFLMDYALALSIFLCALEMILGFALLTGWKVKQMVWGLLLLIVFFGFLTFYSAYFEVVRTCGCFGDAIPLTPWQSFGKDMILLALVLVLFFNMQAIKPILSPKAGRTAFIIAVVFSFGFGIFTYNFSPFVDFLPYKIGNSIPEQMKTPEGADPGEYQITFHLKHKKSGEEKDMSQKEYMDTGIWKDSNWEVVGEPINKVIREGFRPKIADLIIKDANGTEYTSELLSSPFYSVWIVAYNLKHTDIQAIGKLNALAVNLAQNFNTRTLMLTGNSPTDAEAFAKTNRFVPEIFYADGVPLKSMVRANPGIMLIKNGFVINKWHYHNVPSYDELVKTYFRK
ncbi:BT_3928 family protein [Mucilaginibacter myungsuensis]|uniref:DoxX family protein n=1 Tax=Mucilaginibacter myungsuensis TaxID=649104 RepID=A0A929KYZ3_9SPHI|nr:BT_3928 family protein [Mucilaginibacter myungsuensis]MBE9661170.1 DoxX family protein [Mucilaginibacter myungsuensis]MDN3597315.1 DoxX family protein [Mucilaginibacter myungsuensis]